MRSEGLCEWQIAVTPSGIEPATFRLVVQCDNRLSHQQRASWSLLDQPMNFRQFNPIFPKLIPSFRCFPNLYFVKLYLVSDASVTLSSRSYYCSARLSVHTRTSPRKTLNWSLAIVKNRTNKCIRFYWSHNIETHQLLHFPTENTQQDKTVFCNYVGPVSVEICSNYCVVILWL